MNQSAQSVTVSKEHEPEVERLLTQAEQAQVNEVLRHLSEVETKAPSVYEIREHVLAHEVPEVPPELAGHMTPVPGIGTPDVTTLVAPAAQMPTQNRLKMLGRLSARDAGRWLYEWCIRILKIMHLAVQRGKA